MKAMPRVLALLCLPLLLAACAGVSVWAPEEAVQRAAYSHDGPPAITLFTAVNNRSGEGGHSALMINAGQRVLFDPAGTWWHRTVPERNDLLYGITPLMEEFYIGYHARETYHVVAQTVQVPPEVAERALQLVAGNGAVPQSFCATAVSRVLRQLPGFEGIASTMFPGRLMKSFATLPGVETRKYYDDDADDNKALLVSQQSWGAAQPAQ